MRSRAQPHPRQRRGLELGAGAHKTLLDAGRDRLRLPRPAMRHQPAWAFRNPQPHDQDHEAERSADEERDAPSQVGREDRGIEQHDRTGGPERRAHPEAAVDDEVGPAAHARRDELLDRGVDGRVLAADAGPGEEAEQAIAPEIPGEGGGGARREIYGKGDEEELLSSETVGQPAEEDRAEHRTGEVSAAGEPDIRIGEAERRAFLQRAGQRSRQRHLKPVQNPSDAKRHDDEGVEAPQGNRSRRAGMSVSTVSSPTLRVESFPIAAACFAPQT